jgi:hypothetical protein
MLIKYFTIDSPSISRRVSGNTPGRAQLKTLSESRIVAMAKCTACGTTFVDGQRFCVACGKSAELVIQPSLPMPPPNLDPIQVAMASQMAVGARAAVGYQTVVQQQCPRCSHHMIIIYRQSRAYLIPLVLGFPLLVIPIIGWFMAFCLFVFALFLRFGRKGKVRYQCPNCNYSNN